MKKRYLLFVMLGGVSLLTVNACSSMGAKPAMSGQERVGAKMGSGEMMGSSGSYLVPPDKVMAMKKMMMSMKPDTLAAGLKRGEKLFYSETLGDNKSRKSCGTCHDGGGTVGGAAEMEWKGMKMKVNIPTLKGAAAHFPKPMGPMKALVDLASMNNMCIMTFLKGRPIDKNSQQSIDLVAYVTSFSRGKRLEPGADKIVPRPVPGAM
ncbi:MAG: c-type cytochrome [Nitrospiria bacterium]